MPGHVRARKDKNGKTVKRRDGSTIWQARWRKPDDPMVRLEPNFRSKREAERWVTTMETDALRGTYTDPRKAERPLAEVADAWRQTWGDLEPKTCAGYEAILKRHVLPRFGRTKVGTVSTEAVQQFVNELAVKRAPNTVRRVYSVLRAVLRVAVERGYIAVNPCDSVKLRTKKRAGVRRSHLYLEGAELRKLADGIGEPYRVPVYVAGSCGLRAGELWALRRRDVNLLAGTLTVRYAIKEINSSAESLVDDKGLIVGPPKSRASRRTISLPAGLRPMLADILASTGIRAKGKGYAVAREIDEERCNLDYDGDPSDPDRLLFVTTTGRAVRHNLFYKRTFRPVVRSALPARLHAFRWHDLRHTCAALSLAASPSLAVVKERLGHENVQTTVDLYGKLVPSVDAALADAVGASIFTPSEEVPSLAPVRELR